jgi:beta-N-acetylhexosaminidase
MHSWSGHAAEAPDGIEWERAMRSRWGGGGWIGQAERGARQARVRCFIFALLLTLAACAPSAPSANRLITRSMLAQHAQLGLSQHLSADQVAEQMLAHLSLDDKLGQLVIMQFTETTYTSLQAAMVQSYHPGGAILYSYAMGSAGQVKALLADAQRDSPIPMLMMTDLEGGWIDHLAQYVGPHMAAPDMAASGDPQVATVQGAKVAHDLLSFGFNVDLAPDVDVELVAGPDQVGRDFGSTPEPVVTYAGAFLRGLQAGGVVGTLKHFPGLGAATTDAHTDLPVITRSRADLEAVELAPYRALIASGQAQMIMSTDVLTTELDGAMPAELSHPIMTDVLRNELHFNGVAITDALYMTGIQAKWYFAQAAVLAIEAGNDMVMAPFTPGMIGDIFAGLKAALASGALSMDQLDASVQRVLALKLRYHLLPMPTGPAAGPIAGPPPA